MIMMIISENSDKFYCDSHPPEITQDSLYCNISVRSLIRDRQSMWGECCPSYEESFYTPIKVKTVGNLNLRTGQGEDESLGCLLLVVTNFIYVTERMAR